MPCFNQPVFRIFTYPGSDDALHFPVIFIMVDGIFRGSEIYGSRLRFQKAMGQLDNPMKIRNIRKDIARINTVLQEIQKKEAK